ncbi:pyridoxamine 5'-phosphate oxidase family protein [Viridibacillus arvi]|uniref:pyridoxamine 5'-phosphate oxidase family protein n=2 Tax=Viridibacillus arvi TaxID=263475 RepID=UPI00187B532C|nr:pyridoxamine 5'-phosphate oxidase family protein [Viridibacillus sp. JNUCC-6]QOV11753.1 pyridoxamine 5'-phosphate oxidase family protein [Viridibacillus sp. JNUCC-6]
MNNLKDNILSILKDSKVGTMATVHNNKPYSCYMTFFNDDLTLYTATSKETTKYDTLHENPFTHILLGYEGKGFGDTYVEYEGKVTQFDDESMKTKILSKLSGLIFDKPEEMVILKIDPERITLLNKKGEPSQELEMK